MNSRLGIFAGFVAILSLTSQVFASSGYYTAPAGAGTFDNTAFNSNSDNLVNSWGNGGTCYYGQVFTGLQVVNGFSFYLMPYDKSGQPLSTWHSTDVAEPFIAEVSSTGVTLTAQPLWSSTITLANINMGGPAPATLSTLNSWDNNIAATLTKITAPVPGIALDPTKYYMLGFFAETTTGSQTYFWGAQSYSNAGPGGCAYYDHHTFFLDVGTAVNFQTTMLFEVQSTPLPPTQASCNGTNLPFINTTLTSFANNALTVTIQSQVSAAWLSTVYAVGNSTAPQCNYVLNGAYSAFSMAGCLDSFVLNLPWSAYAQCNFQKDLSNPLYTTYKAPIYVTTTSSSKALRGTAENFTETDILWIGVQFPVSVQVSSSVTVYAPVDLLSEVIQSAYYADASSGLVSFVSSLQYPFILTAGAVIATPTGITASAFTEVTTAGACGNTFNSSCLQTFDFNLGATGVCVLTGNYIVNFQVTCRAGVQCPITGTSYANISFALQSTDFCAVVTNTVPVSGSLGVFTDNTFSVPKTAFFQDANAWLKVLVTSSSPLSATTLQSVSILSGASTLATFNAPYPNGLVSNVVNGASTSTFELSLAHATFSVPTDGFENFTITATTGLTYADNSRKRSVLVDSTSPLADSATTAVAIQLSSPSTITTPSDAPTSAPTAAGTPAPYEAVTVNSAAVSVQSSLCAMFSVLVLSWFFAL